MSVLSPQVKQFAIITYKHGMLKLLNKVRPTYPTAFSPPGGLCAHTRKKKGIRKQEHLRRWGGQSAHTRKKGIRKLEEVPKPHRMIAHRPAPRPK